MDEYLFQFICDERRLQYKNTVSQWQKTLCRLIEVMLRRGMPMERLNPRPSYHEESRQARNAEEALLAVLNACARFTENLSHINWPTPDAFGNWLAILQGQRITWRENTLALSCLSFLDLQDCILLNRDLQGANLVGANLAGANLNRAHLEGVHLEGASLLGANLIGASLVGTSLEDISWDESTNWKAVQGIESAWNIPPASPQAAIGAIVGACFICPCLTSFGKSNDRLG